MSHSRVCVTVTAATMAELCRKRDEVADADLIELRLDSVSDPDVGAALDGRSRPLVVTCRPAWEGGAFRGSEDERRRILAEALDRGADWVDVEWRAHFDDLIAATAGRRIVLSYHDFSGVPAGLEGMLGAMQSTGADVVKLAVTTSRLSDCVPLLELGVRAGGGRGIVLVGMGECGLVTRVLPGRFGSMWTYAGSERQLGQVSVETLLKEYHFRTLTGTTDIYGLVGCPVGHSVSPAMHNAAMVASGLDAVYLPFPAATAADFATFGRALRIKGASITTPHKVALVGHVDEVDEVARRVGAINTIQARDGRWIGGNTDVDGFLEPLVDRLALRGMRAAVLGAGGAARAAAVALVSRGCRVRIHARNRSRAEEVAALASADVGPFPPERGSWDLLVNCTPIGMHPDVDRTPLDAAGLTGGCVYDLVYNPGETRLLREAAAAGCQTIGGLEMLVGQARTQFHRWTGIQPPAGLMREAALTRLAEFRRDEHHAV